MTSLRDRLGHYRDSARTAWEERKEAGPPLQGARDEVRRYWDIAKAAWEEQKAAGLPLKRDRDEREFLAAAIELTESPPSPAGRIVAATIIGFFALALIWSIFGKVDIHATLEGRIVPTGKVKVVEPLEPGTVRSIVVREGEFVEEGALLLELDATDSTVDRRRLANDLATSRLEAARLREMLRAGREDLPPDALSLAAPKEANPEDFALQYEVMVSAVAAHRASLASIGSEVAQKLAERARVEASIEERAKLVGVLSERADMYNQLVVNKTGSRNNYLLAAQAMFEERANLMSEQGRLHEIDAGVAALEQRRQELIAQYMSDAVSKLAEVEKRAAAVEDEYLKATQRDDRNRLFAPVRGVVRHITVHTIGEVVAAGETLMTIVPVDSDLEVEAFLLNRDKGFVHEDQEAEVKIEAFPFTKYGTIPGEVVDVSNNSVDDEKRGLIFPVRVAMARGTIRVDGEDRQLTPGMSVTVEVKTGKRRIIEYIMTPLLRYRDEAIRER